MILPVLLILAMDPPVAASAAADGWSLFVRHCITCHSAGGSAPLRLDARAAIFRKSATVAAVLRDRTMPPWLPVAGGPFAHDAVTDQEREAIVAWASKGALGAPEIPRAAPTPDSACAIMVAEGWDVPADGLHMRTFAEHSTGDARPCVADDGRVLRFGTVRLVRASAAVERVMLSIDRSGALRALDGQDPGPGAHVRADAPGSPAGSLAMLGVDGEFRLPAGWFLSGFPGSPPAGAADLAAEIHAVGRGTPLPGTVRILFERAPEAEASPRIAEAFCAGPPGSLREEHAGTATRTDSGPLVRDVDAGVIGLRTDERCIAARVIAIAPGGAQRVLLDIPRYREALDRAYRFDPPIPLGRGTILRIETEHADENAVARSQPMAILWCAARGALAAFPPQPHEPCRALDPDTAAGATPAGGLTWFDAVAACNARSARDGLEPAYRIEHPDRVDGHIVRALVTRVPSTGWRLPHAEGVPVDPAAAADAWWWTDEVSGLSGYGIVAPRDGRRDSLPPSARLPGLWSGITRPAVVRSPK